MSSFDLFNTSLTAYTKQNNQTVYQTREISKRKTSPLRRILEKRVKDGNPPEWYKKRTVESVPNTSTCKIECVHSNIISVNATNVCVDCGEEFKSHVGNNQEWRFYGAQSGGSQDPNRTQKRKSDERNIYKDVENMGFSDKIINEANKIYIQVTNGKIRRGASRRSIVFACVFHAYKMSGKHQSDEKLIDIFDLTRKEGLGGLKHVNLNAPRKSTLRTTYITPINLVREIMELFAATSEHNNEVKILYSLIENTSRKINRSRPKSVAAGLIYYWMCSKDNTKHITLHLFTEKVKLSELTVTNIAEEINSVMCRIRPDYPPVSIRKSHNVV
jgi:hypothetical protein